MSLLWPERIIVGLFPGHCWLQRGAALTAYSGECVNADQMLLTLADMLNTQEEPLRKGVRVQLLVSDSLAFIIPLAWQDLLASQEELRAYALAGFEQRGIVVDDGWVVQTGFRHFRSSGIGYAMKRQWIERLLEILAARGFTLSSMLPVSAAAYWHLPAAHPGKHAVLLCEPGRLTAIVGQGARFLDVDVQPLTGSLEQAATRLLRRAVMAHGAIQHVAEWHAMTENLEELDSVVSTYLPDVAVTRLPLLAWR